MGIEGRPQLADIRELIRAAPERVAQTVNAGLVTLYGQIGQRIRKDILKEKRSAYGYEAQVVCALGTQLGAEFGRGFLARNLANMVRCAEVFPDPTILHPLTAKLIWTHLVYIIYLEASLKRDSYDEMCRIENSSTCTLEKKIGRMLFEPTVLSHKPAKLAEMGQMRLKAENVTQSTALHSGHLHRAPSPDLSVQIRFIRFAFEMKYFGVPSARE